MQMVMIDKAVIEQALAALVRSEVMHGQPNFDIQKNLREALAQPQPVQQAPVGWPAGSVQLHTSLLYMGKAMAKERSREIGDAWNQLADLLYLLSKARTEQPAQPVTVEQIWENDAIMSLNADAGLSLTILEKIVRIVEASHGITKGK